jgi:hypothetical protein
MRTFLADIVNLQKRGHLNLSGNRQSAFKATSVPADLCSSEQ